MKDQDSTATPLQCLEKITHDGWHFNNCGKPAKFLVRDYDPVKGKTVLKPRCGIHVKKYQKRGVPVDKILNGEASEPPPSQSIPNLPGDQK